MQPLGNLYDRNVDQTPAPLVLDRLCGHSPLDAGLIMLPGSLAAALATLLGGAPGLVHDPSAAAISIQVGRTLLQVEAGGYAFQAAYATSR